MSGENTGSIGRAGRGGKSENHFEKQKLIV